MKINVLILGFLISSIISGCTLYYPQIVDIPLISKKKDCRVDAGISVVPTVHATISYGLTKMIAIQGFGSIGIDDSYYYQAAAGLFKKKENNRVIELYGGYGFGYGDQYKDANPGNLFGNYQLYFAQLNYGKIACETSNLEIGFGIKSGLLHSKLLDQNYYAWTSETGPFNTYIDNSLLFEPAGFIRLGGQKFKFSIKLGGTLIYKFTNTEQYFPYSYINLGLGINYTL
jgi:hypothetical protein